MPPLTNLPDLKQRRYGGAYSVHDPEIVAARDRIIQKFTQSNVSDMRVLERIKIEFLELYRDWLFRGFRFAGTELYRHACVTQGTTESFAQFYLRYRHGYRLRLARAEYFYHQMMHHLWYDANFAWLDEDEIREGDVILISVPFSDTGDVPCHLDSLLDTCDRLGVPVMLDMAYLNLATPISFPYHIDLSRPCVEYVVSSLSKVFPVENLRIGIRLQKHKFEDQLYVINEPNYNYLNILSTYVGLGLMQEFGPDYMYCKYHAQQTKLCQDLDLAASPCFVFGIDHKNAWSQYNRGGVTNRLCFSRIWDGRDQLMNLKP
jgi:hypothetical protein